jgi:hypothetical protein
MDIETLKGRLLEIPQEIKSAQLEILDINESLKEKMDKKNQIEASLKAEVAAQLDENGKKMYPNDTARNAALVDKLAEDFEYDDVVEEYNTLQRSIAEKKIDLDLILNIQRNIRAVLGMVTNTEE